MVSLYVLRKLFDCHKNPVPETLSGSVYLLKVVLTIVRLRRPHNFSWLHILFGVANI